MSDGSDRPARSAHGHNGASDWRQGWKRKGWRRGGANATEKNAAIANLDLWQELDRLLVGASVSLEWVKGHAGIIGNERADELSLEGRAAAGLAPQADPLDLIAEQLRYDVGAA